MNSQKTFILAIATLVLIVGTGILYFFAQVRTSSSVQDSPLGTLPTTNTQTGGNTSFPSNATGQSAISNKFEIATTEGGLLVSDFTKAPGVASTTGASFSLSWFPGSTSATSSDNASYEIYYYPEDTFFIVVILKEPIGEVRRQATDDLKEKLGVSDKELCTLVADVNVPYFVNEFYAGKNIGFPGCTGAVKFQGD
ncbi:MAG: hypothetical protein V4449_02230 [Patescibacteria group bacterium]